jgi:hypothetical protein
MAESVEINAAQVLAEFFRQRAQTPENTKIAFDVLKLILNREGYIPSDVTEALAPVNARLDSLISFQQSITTQLGEIMARIDERAAEVSAQLDAATAQQAKALAEIRAALDAALETQITPEELAAAVEEAKATARTESQAEFEAKVDEIFAPLTEKATANKAASQALDDVVPDAPPVEPEEPPVEPEEPPTEPVNP